jgi:hypothetical protein
MFPDHPFAPPPESCPCVRAVAAAVLSLGLAASPAIAPAGSATADAPSERAAAKGCVTKAEYRKIKKGMTIAQVTHRR